MFFKIDVLKNYEFHQKHQCWILIKLQAIRLVALLNRDSNTGVFFETCEIFKHTYFEEHLETATSK